ncbi:MAG: hypothetical protein KGH57_03955 [Candidatus Micrarchaeota archaeon]|nr:hypothetical protein [Candidatus Micrarchaeota archaeon]
MRLTPDMCELIGAIIGDGNIYKNNYVDITGDKNLDLEYLRRRLLPIVKEQLKYVPKIGPGSRSIRLRINNRKFTFFLNNLGIKSGKGKSQTVIIPSKISENWRLAKACIRGIMDTDGCLSFDKRRVYRTPYLRIILHIKNRDLIYQIYSILESRGFAPTYSTQVAYNGRMHTLYLSGKEQVLKYIKDIGFSNKRHILKTRRLIYKQAPVTQW